MLWANKENINYRLYFVLLLMAIAMPHLLANTADGLRAAKNGAFAERRICVPHSSLDK
jgi:hypothetical protein